MPSWGSERAELVAEHVLRAVEQIPSGRVCAYGDIAAIVGCGARQVGSVMRRHGSGVCWWRVVGHDGSLVVFAEALPHWQDEGIGLTDDGRSCRIDVHRADLDLLARAYERAAADLTPLRGA
ncbi:MGMT family protein [Propionicicella superfundia]|uniref:MGMT family protein n=1 Tax=Propionicicella superfundia TaxID=348582 RepID=UPI0003FBAE28|nr:MGMT family protein [Propionicicella superfundia]